MPKSASSDTLARHFALDLVRACEGAAIAASHWIGKGQKEAADAAAVEALRTGLNDIDMQGRIVIGEGERDEAPMLYIGEEVGTGDGEGIDIALDPLEGTTLTAKAGPNALVVVAFARRGNLLNAPDTYMEKIAVGPRHEAGIVDLDAPVEDNIKNLARSKGVSPADITACVLDRPRHDEIIAVLRKLDCRVRLIPDGDVAGVMACAMPDTDVDIYMGTGGAPEGVLAAAALACLGGQFQGRLVIRNKDEEARARKWGIEDISRKYDLADLASGDVVFAATGVTDGSFLRGVRKSRFGTPATHTVVMQASSGDLRWISTEHVGS